MTYSINMLFITSYFWPDNPEIEVSPFECDRAYLYGRELVPIQLPEEHFIQLKLEVRRLTLDINLYIKGWLVGLVLTRDKEKGVICFVLTC